MKKLVFFLISLSICGVGFTAESDETSSKTGLTSSPSCKAVFDGRRVRGKGSTTPACKEGDSTDCDPSKKTSTTNI